MRAPPESFNPITGAPIFAARSMILTIFPAFVSESDPPKTVKSCANNIHQPAFDAAVAGDKAVAVRLLLGHAEVVAVVRDQLVGLFEGAFVEQELDALPRRHFAFFVLPLAALRASTLFGKLVAPFQFCKFFFKIHGGRIIAVGMVWQL